ncbi:hypothetical protein [Erythrobacter donghaensis]|jgi:hypothetical protein|uniref:hypothetical protein n=1 Tax=Erythrobacter donghaensis TaxID=267135 RepID=UPI0009393973|nr:hypothetical protein [Erythrobacter donghaensis]
MVTETAYAKINLALLVAASLVGCAPVDAPKAVSSDGEACERVMSVLAANKTYRADQMAGCDGGKDDNKPGFYVLRVNADCRDPQGCGSVLLGWYAVEGATGAVHEMDVAEWTVGPRIDREK